MKDAALADRCRRLQLILTDVDGVLTDGSVVLYPDGTEPKVFHIHDGMGIVLAQRAGLRVGILSGRTSEATTHRAQELGMSPVVQGVSDKGAALATIVEREGLAPDQVAYMGDDVNDLAVMRAVGLSAAPADAPMDVRLEAVMVTEKAGGRGCFRELIEAILRARGDWDRLVASGT
jgi:3-deoxy-D-manno-octulosonate 8-phosphate phosphatase (KDO 8-P phosphatase)